MSITLPDYWLPQPSFLVNPALRAEFDALIAQAMNWGVTTPLDYSLDVPKWQFLCYAADEAGLALHGSPNPEITRFEPRQPKDLREFGAQNAVYAASDGIWPMYFAILNRQRFPSTIMNGCIRLELPGGEAAGPYYFFSIGRHIFDKNPWSTGWVYLLPRDFFNPDPPFPFGEAVVHVQQLASLTSVAPFARLEVTPSDFPFLAEMRAHDDERLEEYSQALSQGLPWPESGSS